jgi:hypothetical protein
VLSRFAASLNSGEAELLAAVAPTDSRLRPDIRALERGECVPAAAPLPATQPRPADDKHAARAEFVLPTREGVPHRCR